MSRRKTPDFMRGSYSGVALHAGHTLRLGSGSESGVYAPPPPRPPNHKGRLSRVLRAWDFQTQGMEEPCPVREKQVIHFTVFLGTHSGRGCVWTQAVARGIPWRSRPGPAGPPMGTPPSWAWGGTVDTTKGVRLGLEQK